MKFFSFRCISCGCIATVVLWLPLIAVAKTKKAHAAAIDTKKVGSAQSGSSVSNTRVAKTTIDREPIDRTFHGSSGQAGGGKNGKKSSQGAVGGGGKGNPARFPAAAAAAFSDLRVKNNISFVGWSPTGIPIYRFSYITEPNKRYQGTIAQAIILIRPDAVIWQNGLMLVDYSRLDIEMEELPSALVEEDGHVNPQ